MARVPRSRRRPSNPKRPPGLRSSLGHGPETLASLGPGAALAPGAGLADLARAFERFRAEAELLRTVIARTGGLPLARSPEAEAQTNLRLVRSVFGKWSIDLLVVLGAVASARFSDLRRSLRGISSDVLSRKLRALEAAGLVERRVGDGRPPPVTYRLTDDGLTLTRLGEPILLFLRLRGGGPATADGPADPPGREGAGRS